MKCWKCGKDLPDNTSVCNYCGASMNRKAPVTEPGRAMRQIYDRFGNEAVLSKRSMMPVALGDLLEDSKKLRNQVEMALSSGVGGIYVNQIQSVGKPDANFRTRVKTLMTDEAGLSEKVAAELMGCFDEMIGWDAPAQSAAPSGGAATQPRPEPAREIPRPAPNNEIPRPTPNKEIPRPAPTPTPRPQPAPAPAKPLVDALVPKNPTKPSAFARGFYMTLIVGVAVVGVTQLITLWPVGLFCIAMALFLYKTKEENLLPNGQVLLKCVLKGEMVEVSWSTHRGEPMAYAIAVDGEWVARGNGNSVQLKLNPNTTSSITLAEITGKGVVFRGERTWPLCEKK